MALPSIAGGAKASAQRRPAISLNGVGAPGTSRNIKKDAALKARIDQIERDASSCDTGSVDTLLDTPFSDRSGDPFYLRGHAVEALF